MSDKVTIVLRTRNRPRMLARALASIGAQTFTGYRVVVVNDAGDEQQVRAVVDAQDPGLRERVELVTNKTSKGREAALESGLAASALEYFAVHDDDDAWHPQFLEETVAHLNAHPELGGVTTRCEIVRERVRADGECTEIERETLSTDSSGLSLVDTLVENYAPPISQLIRRRVADRIGHWDGTLSTQADWEFNLRLLAAPPRHRGPGPGQLHRHRREGPRVGQPAHPGPLPPLRTRLTGPRQTQPRPSPAQRRAVPADPRRAAPRGREHPLRTRLGPRRHGEHDGVPARRGARAAAGGLRAARPGGVP